jgi:hypothetical protein
MWRWSCHHLPCLLTPPAQPLMGRNWPFYVIISPPTRSVTTQKCLFLIMPVRGMPETIST